MHVDQKNGGNLKKKNILMEKEPRDILLKNITYVVFRIISRF